MTSPASPADTRASIVERLVGDTGEPEQVEAAARALAERSVPAIMRGLEESMATPLAIEVASIELCRFVEARPDAANHAMTIAASASSPDALVLSIDNDGLAVVVGTLFGGDPQEPVPPIERDLSPLEIDVATMVFEQVAQAMNGSGPRAFEFKLPLPLAITGKDMARRILRDGPAVRVCFSLATPASRGTMALTMPQRVLLKHRGDTGMAAREGAPASEWRDRFSEEVMRSTVTLEATMPLSRLTLADLATFEEGQVIELDEAAQTQARLSARGQTLFVCEFGKLGQNYTVRVRHPFDAGQDFIDGLLPG
ncbi:FliM/FliN family flagellar motor switch protein [Aquamicrobium soli]|uniref:Flagellar motor switch protein FliM n=1 Tax=Aquamicrobium soli TaxID=1811518 RepID=A0ABV7K8I0_9HYPH